MNLTIGTRFRSGIRASERSSFEFNSFIIYEAVDDTASFYYNHQYMNTLLKIQNLRASADGAQILNDVNIAIDCGETHAIMGPNGSGKSTLAHVIAGNPNYEITDGSMIYGQRSADCDLMELSPDERACAGIFLAFQYPIAIPGVPVISLIRAAYNAQNPDDKLTIAKIRKLLEAEADKLHIDKSFIDRSVNEGFSGGEKKKLEMLQMITLKPKLIILDETDSGLDVDSLQIVSEAINRYKKDNTDVGILIITHYQRILRYIKPDHVHVMKDGRIVRSGDATLAEELEKTGYRDIVKVKNQNA